MVCAVVCAVRPFSVCVCFLGGMFLGHEAQNDNNNPAYNKAQIQVLEGLEGFASVLPCIGNTDSKGLHHLVYGGRQQHRRALAGYCDTISVTLGKDVSVTVEDNGRGIPVGIHPHEGKPALSRAHRARRRKVRGRRLPRVRRSSRRRLVGCERPFRRLEVWVKLDGRLHYQGYTRGVPDAPFA